VIEHLSVFDHAGFFSPLAMKGFTMFGRMIQAAAMVVAIATPALGLDWTTKMFETTSHDFGTVARGERAEFEFVLKNLYVEDVHNHSK
jgi:hypothetical protein